MITTSSFGVRPWPQAIQPVQTVVNPFWQAEHVHENLKNMWETLDLLKAVHNELEQILLIRSSGQNNAKGDDLSPVRLSDCTFSSSLKDTFLVDGLQYSESSTYRQFFEAVKAKRISVTDQESLSLQAAKSLYSTIKNQLTPFGVITSQTSSWEERSMAVRLSQKLQKSRRNKRWKKKRRKYVAEQMHKELEGYDRADQDADEWRAREIAKDIAMRKVESMKEIAKFKANEDRKKLESELELVLVVEKLQDLRSIRIQKLKKQGHFLPEEDDKFLERVRAAVEEEECQAAAAADTGAAKDAITTAEESRKAIQYTSTESRVVNHDKFVAISTSNQDQLRAMESERGSGLDLKMEPEADKVEGHNCAGGYDSVSNLPLEFYHYYYGSSNDMGTLIEVRRTWDAYIRPGGSRIPGHFVRPPPPANQVWESYLVRPK